MSDEIRDALATGDVAQLGAAVKRAYDEAPWEPVEPYPNDVIDWTSDRAIKVIDDATAGARKHFAAEDGTVVVTEEVAGYLRGFLDGRGMAADLMDVVLARLNGRAVSK